MNDRVLEEFVGSLTLNELRARTGCDVGQLVAFCFGAGRLQSTEPKVQTQQRAKRDVETRSQSGREALDAVLLARLESAEEGLGARELADELGATLPQVRSSVARLAERRKVWMKGKTAARRYWAAGLPEKS